MKNETVARLFGCTVEQVRALHGRNSRSLSDMAAKAEKLGRKVNGYDAAKLRAFAGDALKRSIP